MKKIILAMSVLGALSASEISDKAIEFVKTLTPAENIDIELVKSDKIPNSKYEMVEFNILANGQVVGSDVFFSDGKFATPTLFDLDEKVDLRAKFMEKKEQEKQKALQAQLPNFIKNNKDMTIKLGNKNNGVATVVFSDPDCPWCRKHLETIEDSLKDNDIIFVLTPLPMHKTALSKTLHILEEVKTAKSDSDKLKIIRKYYSDATFDEVSQDKKDAYSKKVDAAFKLGVNYTPAIFENVKLK
ncbi:thioredoxin domain-containing protein [Campylobacter sp. MG1]|uniref:thioredoxin domain-containing protein n=1 Tax=Campylobacter sp. MG1 TaxID=2976332 RepID=UPI00226CF8D2|nr:thioredoxin domain-containing protein [Campylobacter sp. MG1]